MEVLHDMGCLPKEYYGTPAAEGLERDDDEVSDEKVPMSPEAQQAVSNLKNHAFTMFTLEESGDTDFQDYGIAERSIESAITMLNVGIREMVLGAIGVEFPYEGCPPTLEAEILGKGHYRTQVGMGKGIMGVSVPPDGIIMGGSDKTVPVGSEFPMGYSLPRRGLIAEPSKIHGTIFSSEALEDSLEVPSPLGSGRIGPCDRAGYRNQDKVESGEMPRKPGEIKDHFNQDNNQPDTAE